MRFILISAVLSGVIACYDALQAQIPETRGFVPYQTYTPEDYGGNPQNWDLFQDSDGFLYIANSGGVLIFDGSTWQTIQLDRGRPARNLAKGADGRIYVSGFGEIGYLSSDSTGRISYTSLVPMLPGEPELTSVWDAVTFSDGVYFRSPEHLIRWDYESMKVWKADRDDTFGRLYNWRDHPVINQTSGYLKTLRGDSLVPVLSDPSLNNGVFGFFERPDSVIVIGVQNEGLKKLVHRDDGTDWYFEMLPFETELDRVMDRVTPYGSKLMSGGYMAFNTVNAGILITDREGAIVDQLTEEHGLMINLVINLAGDREGGLWALTNNGITRFEINRPVRLWDSRLGLRGSVQSVKRVGERLYAATSQGLFRMDTDPDMGGEPDAIRKPHRFYHISGTPEIQTWDLLPVADVAATDDDGVIVASHLGVYMFADDRMVTIYTPDPGSVNSLYNSQFHDHTFYAGMESGVLVITVDPDYGHGSRGLSEDSFQVTIIPLEGVEVRTIQEDQYGYLWLGNRFADVVRLDVRENPHDPDPESYRFGTEYPFIVDIDNDVHGLEDQLVMLAGYENVFYLSDRHYDRFHDADSIPPEIFQVDLRFHRQPGMENLMVGRIKSSRDGSGDIWYSDHSRAQLLFKTDDGEEVAGEDAAGSEAGENGFGVHPETPDTTGWITDRNILGDMYLSRLYTSYTESDGKVWFGGVNGLIMLDRSLPDFRSVSYPATVRSIYDRDNTLLYSASALHSRYIDRDGPVHITLPYYRNSVRLHYAASTFVDTENTVYQVKMDGFEDEWSDWSSLDFREYTNLREGEYTFRVRALNSYGQTGVEGVVYLTVLPPWYRTWPAYFMYAFLLIGIGLVILRWRTSRLKKRNRMLEESIENRTRELRIEKEKLEKAEELRSRFMNVIAHDIRNPVSIVMGYSEILESEKNDPEAVTEYGSYIHSASGRVLRLLDELVNYNQIAGGEMETNYEKVNMNEIAETIAENFKVLTMIKSQKLSVSIEEDCIVETDRNKVQSIIENLLGNAIKFTQKEGRIGLRIHTEKDRGEFVLMVTDDGQGFSDEDKSNMFRQFGKLSARPTQGEGSTGLGLYIVKNMVDLLGGSLDLESEKGKGSVFTVRLPLEKPEENATGN